MLELSLPNPATASYAFAALAFTAFAARLAVGWQGGARAYGLFTAIGLSALWATLDLAFALSREPTLWLGQSLVDGLRMSAWLLFAMLLLGSRPRLQLGLGAALVACVALFVVDQPQPLGAPTGVSRAPFAVLLGLAVAGLVATEQIFRRSADSGRWALKPLCLALGASFVFDLYVHADALLLGRLDPDLWAARGLAQALVIPFIAMATARNKDWTIDIAFSRGVVLHSTAFLASGIYLLAVAAAGYYVRYFGGSWGKTVQIGFIFAALLTLAALFASGSLRSKARVFVNKNFFSYRYDYRQEWLRFTNRLSLNEPGVDIAQRSVQALADLVESPGGALWSRDAEGRFVPAGRWNVSEVRETMAAGDSLPTFLAKTGWVVDLAEYRVQPARYDDFGLPRWLAEWEAAWLVIPIITRDELVGFTVLVSPRARIDVNWEVRDLLKAAARQVGSVLAQVQASEALLEARKFEAFNKMSAFVVHDLKNLVAQLSLLLKNAERHRANPAFQEDMLATVKHVTERMNRLLLQLSTGSRGEEPLRPVDLGKLASRVLQTKVHERSDIALEDAGEVLALAHEQRFERVVGHLVQNAIDATRQGGSVRVGVFAEDRHAVLEVRDTGCGMSEAFLREKLFRPFQTTKAAGMGIGAFETAQYVKEMGGRIEADSRQGSGTRIKVILPLHREQAAAGERAREAA